MNTRKVAAEYRLSSWAEIIRERNASGMSIREFCKRSGYHEYTYFYWLRKLREATCTELAGKGQEKSVESGKQSLVPSGWTVCEKAVESKKKEMLAVEIGKCRVLIEAETDTELLARVCRTLMSLC